jgi:intein/homing endonuclease
MKAGDSVLSFDPVTGKMIANEVGELITAKADSYYLITTASGRQIRATAEHPMYVGKKTWWQRLLSNIFDSYRIKL